MPLYGTALVMAMLQSSLLSISWAAMASSVEACLPTSIPVQCEDGVELTLDDLQVIRDIAEAFDFSNIERVFAGNIRHPLKCLGVRVTQRTPRSGAVRVYQKTLTLWRSEWNHCDLHRIKQDLLAKDGWVSSGKAIEETVLWKIRDGSWAIDIQLGDGVPYTDAVQIVRAIRHRHVVISNENQLIELSRMNASKISTVTREIPFQMEGHEGRALYTVIAFRGRFAADTLTVSLEGEKVWFEQSGVMFF